MNLATQLVSHSPCRREWYESSSALEHPTPPSDPDIEIKNSPGSWRGRSRLRAPSGRGAGRSPSKRLRCPKTRPSCGPCERSVDWSNSPPSRRRKASMRAAGQCDRLAIVRFLTLPFPRKDWRNSMAGGELRLGTVAKYTTSVYSQLVSI